MSCFGFGDGGFSLPLQVRPGHDEIQIRSRISDRRKLFLCCPRASLDDAALHPLVRVAIDIELALALLLMNVIDSCSCHCHCRCQ